jgi:hypothetical protein
VFFGHVFLLALTDAMLAGYCPAKRQCDSVYVRFKLLGFRQFFGIVRVKQNQQMEIAVPNMPNEWNDQTSLVNNVLAASDTVRKVRDGDTAISDNAAAFAK